MCIFPDIISKSAIVDNLVPITVDENANTFKSKQRGENVNLQFSTGSDY